MEHRALVAAARSSFSKLMDHMAQFFPSVSLQPVAALRDRRSLAGRLGRTLARKLQGKSAVEKDFLVSSQVCSAGMRVGVGGIRNFLDVMVNIRSWCSMFTILY